MTIIYIFNRCIACRGSVWGLLWRRYQVPLLQRAEESTLYNNNKVSFAVIDLILCHDAGVLHVYSLHQEYWFWLWVGIKECVSLSTTELSSKAISLTYVDSLVHPISSAFSSTEWPPRLRLKKFPRWFDDDYSREESLEPPSDTIDVDHNSIAYNWDYIFHSFWRWWRRCYFLLKRRKRMVYHIIGRWFSCFHGICVSLLSHLIQSIPKIDAPMPLENVSAKMAFSSASVLNKA